jgi:hypothetical protein
MIAAKLKKQLLLVIIINCSATQLYAQTDWLNWNGVTVSGSISNRFSARVGHTRAYNLSNNYTGVFSQSHLQFTYELNKKWDLQGGLQLIAPADTNETRKRVFVRVANTIRLTKNINWTNSLRAETNSKNENRFRQRIIFTTRLGLRKRLYFLKLAPSLSYSLFYNIGGNPIRYYDKDAQLIARQTPDGFHRSRFTINLNSKITNYFSLSFYYMRQQEFNFLTQHTRKMNVFDPVRNRTLRPFNNYNTLGLTAQFNINPLIKNK